MSATQEFLVLETGESLAVYGVRDLPAGTIVGGQARRLRVVGRNLVQPPGPRLTVEEWERWTRQLSQDGFETTVESFWR